MKEKIKIEIEIGHWAKRLSAAPSQLPNSAVQNATHVWKAWVCGCKGQLESFVQRAVFRLHPSFPSPVRVVNEPPFEIEEKAFGTFPMKIELHFNDSMAAFDYEVFLMLDRDINCKSIKSFSIANPRPPEFREKLLLAGGVVVDSSDEASGSTDSQSQSSKASRVSKSHGNSSLVRHKSKNKPGSASSLQLDDPMFASPASSEELAGQALSPSSQQQQQQQQQSSLVAPSLPSFMTVGSRLASPSKAKLKEPSGYTGLARSPAKPKSTPPQVPAASAVLTTTVVKAEPIFGVISPSLPALPYAEPSPRVSELRTEEAPIKGEKLVLKISKSPIKSSPIATIKTEPIATYATDASMQQQQPHVPVTLVVSTNSPPPLPLPLAQPVVVPKIEAFAETLIPPATMPTAEPPPPLGDPTAIVTESLASASEDDRRKRKKEKRKKDKDRHRHRDRSHGSGAESDSDERRHEKKRRRHHEGKERKKSKRQEGEETETGVVTTTTSSEVEVLPLASVMPSGLGYEATTVAVTQSAQPQAPPPPTTQQQQQQPPPPTLEAEPPMLSPYLMSAGPKEDPELMSQASVESTGFRPPAGDCGSCGSSPAAASAAIPVSAAAMAAETAAAAAEASSLNSAFARHPKYQWTADLGLSRAEYDQRFQLCLLAASLEDPGRLERLAAVLAASGALTARDQEYAHFDLARLGPDYVRQLRLLLMPDAASG